MGATFISVPQQAVARAPSDLPLERRNVAHQLGKRVGEEVEHPLDISLRACVVEHADANCIAPAQPSRRNEPEAALLERGNEAGVEPVELVLVVDSAEAAAKAHDAE